MQYHVAASLTVSPSARIQHEALDKAAARDLFYRRQIAFEFGGYRLTDVLLDEGTLLPSLVLYREKAGKQILNDAIYLSITPCRPTMKAGSGRTKICPCCWSIGVTRRHQPDRQAETDAFERGAARFSAVSESA